ncbi:MAG: CsbD family protein [Thermoanaerobaculia bacterium]
MNEREKQDRQQSIWSEVEGNWNEFKGRMREKWGDLSDDELERMAGHRDRIVGTIQQRYGREKWSEANIERELGNMRRG